MSGGGGDNKIDETEQQRALADVAMRRWQDYQQNFRPFENDFMRDIDRLNSEDSYRRAANVGAAAVNSEFSNAINQSAVRLGAAGINPQSGLFRGELDKLERQKAKVKADTMNQSQVSQQDRYAQGLQNVVAMGQGQAGEAMAGFGDIAGNANRYARNEARNDMSNRLDNQAAAGMGVGIGARYGLNYLDGGS